MRQFLTIASNAFLELVRQPVYLLLMTCSAVFSVISEGHHCLYCGRPGRTGREAKPPHGVPMYHATIGVPEILRTLDESGCTCRHLEYDQYPELHVYVVAQKT